MPIEELSWENAERTIKYFGKSGATTHEVRLWLEKECLCMGIQTELEQAEAFHMRILRPLMFAANGMMVSTNTETSKNPWDRVNFASQYRGYADHIIALLAEIMANHRVANILAKHYNPSYVARNDIATRLIGAVKNHKQRIIPSLLCEVLMNRIERECAKKIKENSLIKNMENTITTTEPVPASSPPVSARQTRHQLAGGGFRPVGNNETFGFYVGVTTRDSCSAHNS